MRSSFSTLSIPLTGGLLVGISGPVLEKAGGPVGHAASVILVAGWTYALLGFSSGLLAKTKVQAVTLSIVSLWVTVSAYYLTKATQGDFTQASYEEPTGPTVFAWSDFLSMLAVWFFFALLLGSLCGIAGYFARTGPYRLPFRILVPAVALVETSMRLSAEADIQEALVGATWSVTRILAVAAILLLVGVSALEARKRRSAERA